MLLVLVKHARLVLIVMILNYCTINGSARFADVASRFYSLLPIRFAKIASVNFARRKKQELWFSNKL